MAAILMLALLALLAMLAACGGEEAPAGQLPAAGPEDQVETPAGEPLREARPGSVHGEHDVGVESEVAYTPIESLAPTRQLDVTVEGQREAREARLFKSPQGYAIYVLPQLVMTPEEPCCDLAYARVDDGFFMRIERIDDAMDLATLRENMQLALSSVGPAEEASVQAYFPPEARAEAELSMRAVGDGVSMAMLVARIDGGRYRVTQHLPHREALEGILPSFRAMLGSLRTTGPRGDR